MRHYNYFLHLEPEYSPRNPHIFDDDASFFLIPNKFYPEQFAFESINYRNHYIQATGEGKLKISSYEDTEQFHNSASFALTDHFVKRTYVYIKSLFLSTAEAVWCQIELIGSMAGLPWVWRFPWGFPWIWVWDGYGECDESSWFCGNSVGILDGCEIKRKRVKYAIKVIVDVGSAPNRV